MSEFTRSVAVVVGINKYQNGISQLHTATEDATELSRILTETYNYKVEQLLDEEATLENLKQLLWETLPNKIRPTEEDRVLFYFAGHGTALNSEDGPTGYLVPQNAKPEVRDTFLPMQELHNALTSLECRHLLTILDCCFAGAFRWSSTRDLLAAPEVIHKERYDRFVKDAAWQVITSAAHDQKALDILLDNRGISARDAKHSPFAEALFEAFQGGADLIPDGIITATELYLYLRDHVEIRADERQTPGLWPLKKHRKGEYIFLLPSYKPDKLPPAPELNEENNPYRGLESYDEKHSSLFFGRKELVEKLYLRIANPAHQLTVVLGASGSGKSSLVKAGLIPYLRNSLEVNLVNAYILTSAIFLAFPLFPIKFWSINCVHEWHILDPIRPGESPFTALARGIMPISQVAAASDIDSINQLNRNLQQEPQKFIDIVAAWRKDKPKVRLLLVIDQFEELITQCQDDEERQEFLGLLEKALTAHPQHLYIVLTLRSDFEPRFLDSPLKSHWMQARFAVRAMRSDELRQAIEGPASERVLYFEPPNLVDQLIDEVGQMPGALPLLSFTLSELYIKYLKRKSDDRALTEKDYKELGGVVGSLTNRATEEYEKLDIAHQVTMRRVMLRMVTIEGGESARRRVPLSELLYLDPEANKRVEEVIKRLSEARLIVGGQETGGEPYVEPAHDALVRGWKKLQEWKEQEQGNLALQQRLTPAANDWIRNNREIEYLWTRDPRLALLEKVIESKSNNWLNHIETEFVKSSIKQRQDELEEALRLAEERRQQLARSQRLLYGANLNLASQAWNSANITPMSELLDSLRPQAGQEDVRGFEWYYLWKLAHSDRLTLRAPDKTFTSVAVSPDGKTLATVISDMRTMSPENAIKLWDITTGKELATYEGHTEGTVCLEFSPDGKILATGGLNDGNVRFLDVRTGKEIGHYRPNVEREDNTVHSVKFSPDGKTVALLIEPLNNATGASFHTLMYFSWNVRLLDVASGQEKTNFHSGDVRYMAFSPDRKTFATGYGSTVNLWDLTTGAQIDTIELENGWARSIAFSPDGRKLAMGGDEVRLWDVVDKGTPQRVGRHEESIVSVVFSQDGKRLATASQDRTATIWNTTTYEELAIVKGHRGSISSIAFSPDGKTLVTASQQDRTAKLWDVDRVLKRADSGGDSFAVSPDGKTLVVWDAGSSFGRVVVNSSSPVKLLDVGTGLELVSLNSGSYDTKSVAFAPDSKILVIWDTGAVRLWNVNTGQEITNLLQWTWEDDFSQIHSLAFSPDGKTLAVGGNQAVKLWNITTWQKLPSLKVSEGYVQSMAFSPDSKILVTGDTDGTIKLWDAYIWQEQDSFKAQENSIDFLMFPPNKGRMLIAGSDYGTIKLWDITNWQELTTVEGRNSDRSLAFPPDGKLMAFVSNDGSVKLWDLSTRKEELITFRGHTDKVMSVAFSPDGKTLVAGCADETVKFWNVFTGQEVLTLRANLGSVRSVGFAPDCKTVITGHWRDDGRVIKLWHTAKDEEILIQSMSPDARTLFEEAKSLASEENLEGAVAKLREIKALTPNLNLDPEAEVLRLRIQSLIDFGRKLAGEKNFQDAVATFSKVRELNPKLALDPEVEAQRSFMMACQPLSAEGEKHIKQGFDYRNQADPQKALAEFQKGIELMVKPLEKGYPLSPMLVEACLECGVIYFVQGEYEKAVDIWKKATEVKPDDARAYSNIGFACYELDRLDDAIEQWQTVVRIDSQSDEAWAGLGIALYDKSHIEEAIAAYQKALEIESSFASVEWLRDTRSWSEKSLRSATELLQLFPKP